MAVNGERVPTNGIGVGRSSSCFAHDNTREDGVEAPRVANQHPFTESRESTPHSRPTNQNLAIKINPSRPNSPSQTHPITSSNMSDRAPNPGEPNYHVFFYDSYNTVPSPSLTATPS